MVVLLYLGDHVTHSGKFALKYKVSTGTDSLKQAKEIAFELALDAWFKERNNIPVATKNFKYIANLVIKELEQLLGNSQGKVTYLDYIGALKNYMIPFLGKYTLPRTAILASVIVLKSSFEKPQDI